MRPPALAGRRSLQGRSVPGTALRSSARPPPLREERRTSRPPRRSPLRRRRRGPPGRRPCSSRALLSVGPLDRDLLPTVSSSLPLSSDLPAIADVLAGGVVVPPVHFPQPGTVKVYGDGRLPGRIACPVNASIVGQDSRGPVLQAPHQLPHLLQASV